MTGSSLLSATHAPPTASSSPVLRCRHVTRVFGSGPLAVRALDGIDLEVPAGAFTAVMGPSGSGKSTLMNVAAGLDDCTAGEVWLAGQPLHELGDDERTVLRRDHVGFIFQAFNLVPTLDVVDNVLLPLRLTGRQLTDHQLAWADHLLGVLGLADRRTHRPHELSGGQQQRVAIARALAAKPAVIFADEPTGNLDTRSSREVLALLRAASAEYGQSIVMVSHDPVAASYADRMVLIADGRVAGDFGRRSAEEISHLLIELEASAS